jgi:hypothetical protein
MLNRSRSLQKGCLRLVLGVSALALFATLNAFSATPGQVTEAMFPHMDAALGYLQAADQQLKGAQAKFYGHREAAIQHTGAAIAHIQKGINDFMASHPGKTRNQAIPEAPPSEAGQKYPAMKAALALLQHAETHLNEAAKQYNGQRIDALNETRAAISEVQAGIREAAAHGEK